MPVEEPGEDEPGGPPPHPLDRVWFHPSEVGAALAAWRAGPTPRRRDWGLVAVVALASVAVTVGVLAAAGVFAGSSHGSGRPTIAAPATAAPWADIVSAVAPSVVSVRAISTSSESQGSGVAMDGSRVLTSTSLVGSATTIMVGSAGGHLGQAQVLGADPDTDLTLLSVDGGDFPAAKVGSSDGLHIGDGVLALGLSTGRAPWAGEGIVSALDKVSSAPGGDVLTGLVDTDVRMSPTAAGGALVDSGGSVVGILSAALPGQAVPIDVAHDVVTQLEASGRVHHGWLGVATIDAINRAGAGAAITMVVPNSPAASAGLAPGDVVTAVTADGNTEHVTDAGDLVASVEELRNGDPATLTVARGSGHAVHQVSLGDRPAGTATLAGLAA